MSYRLPSGIANKTSVKTSGYSAAVGDFVLADGTNGGFTVYLPAAPKEFSVVWIKKIDETNNSILVQRSGLDVFESPGGPSILQLITPGHSVYLQYNSGVWSILSNSSPPSSLDSRFFARSNVLKDINDSVAVQLIAANNAVNYLGIANAATTGSVLLRAQGDDADISLGLVPKGTLGGVSVVSGDGNNVFTVWPTSSPSNYWRFRGGNAGGNITAYAASPSNGDANVSMDFIPKGTGKVKANGIDLVDVSSAQTLTNKTLTSPVFTTPTLTTPTLTNPKVNQINDSEGATALSIVAVANAANYIQLSPTASAGGGPSLQALGVDANLPINLYGKGSSGVNLRCSNGLILTTTAAASSVNYLSLSSTATGGTPTFTATSSVDNNVSINIAPKGSGTVQAGGVDVVTTTGTQILSNKTLSGNTIHSVNGTIELYNTADQTTNYEKLSVRYTSNVAEIVSLYGGTGIGRFVKLGVAAAAGGGISRFLQVQPITPFISLQWGATGVTGNINSVGTTASTFVASSGSQVALSIDPTCSQTGTAGYTMLLVNPTESSNTGSGTKLLADFQMGGSSKAKIDTFGLLTATNLIESSTSTATAAGTTTLTNSSTGVQVFTGSTTQIVKLPTTSIVAGQSYTIINNSTGTVTVQSSDATSIIGLTASRVATFVAKVDTPTTGANWIVSGLTSSPASSITTMAQRDSSGALFANNFIATKTATATAAATTTLTNSSSQVQEFTGSTTQTVTLPTTYITAGMQYTIVNNSSGAVTVQSSGANTVSTVSAGTLQLFVAQKDTPTAAADWRAI